MKLKFRKPRYYTLHVFESSFKKYFNMYGESEIEKDSERERERERGSNLSN